MPSLKAIVKLSSNIVTMGICGLLLGCGLSNVQKIFNLIHPIKMVCLLFQRSVIMLPFLRLPYIFIRLMRLGKGSPDL